jgi:succinate dehydrogenase cytochrome b556 subunit
MNNKTNELELSPHLSIYAAQFTSILSGFHRASGVFLSICLFVLPLELYLFLGIGISLNLNNFVFEIIYFGLKVLILGFTFYHFSTGIRHLFWDNTQGFFNKININSYFVLITIWWLCSYSFI